MKLLLVDDEPGIREGLAALLRRKGHEVVTAGDCARAAGLLAGGGAADFDLVLTDWRLPDGIAADFLAGVDCTAIAMTGHPEEVRGRHPALRDVLTKPVKPAVLLETISALHPEPAPSDAGDELPRDVARLVESARALLPGLTVEDDGTFVTARAPLPEALADDEAIAELSQLGGDLRILAPAGVATAEVRWCRDGRPDPGIPVAAPAGAWPDAPEFAVDFAATPDPAIATPRSAALFQRCLDRAVEARGRGRTVHFLNVPDSLLSWASDQGRGDDMPMRAMVGPRLPAVLADLWSQA